MSKLPLISSFIKENQVVYCLSYLDCKLTDRGYNYTGQHKIAVSGQVCQRWDSQTPHPHNNNELSMFPDATLEDAANNCRNPDDEQRPWCYTTDPYLRWEYCDIPKCEGSLSWHVVIPNSLLHTLSSQTVASSEQICGQNNCDILPI